MPKKKKVLVSWFSPTGDFIRGTEQLDENGVNFSLLNYLEKQKKFHHQEHHLLSTYPLSHKGFEYFFKELTRRFDDDFHTTVLHHITLDDFNDFNEIKAKVRERLVPLKNCDIDVLFSAGTGMMQVSWVALRSELYQHQITLWQLLKAEHTPEGQSPLRKMKFQATEKPTNIFLHQQQIRQQDDAAEPSEDGFFLSASIKPVYDKASLLAQEDVRILIRGESGTGKEHLARYIQENSRRAQRTKKNAKSDKELYIAINCSAFVSDDLLRSELFGHVKGAFTGAIGDKIGIFERADGGTVFLDEIGDISPGMQVMLLRFLQEGEIQPVGGSEVKKVDVRIIAASHHDLVQRCQEGKFRWDLFFRLAEFELELPPLKRWSKMDKRKLLEQLLHTKQQQLYKAKKSELTIDDFQQKALDYLLNYSYPGNIRQLENIVTHLCIECNGKVRHEDLPKRLIEIADIHQSQKNRKPETEKEELLRVYKENNYKIMNTAEALGIDRRTFKERMISAGLEEFLRKSRSR